MICSANKAACHTTNIKTSYLSQNINRIISVRFVYLQSFFNNSLFILISFFCKSGTFPHNQIRIHAGKCHYYSTAGTGIAYAHFAHAHAVAAVACEGVGDFTPALQRGIDAEALERAHKRLADGMEKEFFEQNNAKLNRTLQEQLGPAASPYLLASEGKRPDTRRGLTLPLSTITLR